MVVKIIILGFMLIILLSLGWGFYYLSRDKGESRRTLHALIFRMGITVLLVILILLGIYTGIIVPHPLG